MRRTSLFAILLFTVVTTNAQDITSVIGEGITRVIRAIDLSIQRAQNQTIILQEAQQTLENAMSSTLLDDIRGWVEQQKDLYAGYFTELQQVKAVVADYHRVKEAIKRQEAIVTLYQQSLRQFRNNAHFSPAEESYMEVAFTSVLNESERNLEQLLMATTAGAFQMTDQQRLSTIDQAADSIDKDYRTLQSFTQQNQLLSLQRARDENDYLTLLKLYGL